MQWFFVARVVVVYPPALISTEYPLALGNITAQSPDLSVMLMYFLLLSWLVDVITACHKGLPGKHLSFTLTYSTQSSAETKLVVANTRVHPASINTIYLVNNNKLNIVFITTPSEIHLSSSLAQKKINCGVVELCSLMSCWVLTFRKINSS